MTSRGSSKRTDILPGSLPTLREVTRIILVRHGQTEWNQVERFRGHADVPLNATGRRQASLTADRIAAEWMPSAIYASPLSRTLDTAGAIGEAVGVPAQPYKGLLDIDFGAWQGLTPEEVAARWPQASRTWYAEPQKAQNSWG